jgi:hypothetical protein
MRCHPPLAYIYIYIKSSGGGKRPYYPYNIKGRYTPLKGNLRKK